MTAPPGVPACRDTDNPAIFESTKVLDHEKAVAVCATCPADVKAWCLEEREEAKVRGGTPTGTWGGLLWLDNGHPLSIEHGTDRGYNQHRYRGDEPCRPCHRAHLAHEKAKRDAKRLAVANA